MPHVQSTQNLLVLSIHIELVCIFHMMDSMQPPIRNTLRYKLMVLHIQQVSQNK